MKKIVFIITTFIMLVGLTACGRPVNTTESSETTRTATPEAETIQSSVAQTTDPSHRITVNSSEHVSVVPDIAEVVYSVRTKGSTASGCQQQNSGDVGQQWKPGLLWSISF